MNITKLAIKNNVVTFAFLVVMIFAGLSAFEQMPRDDMPPFLIRAINIVTSFPGASPERVEQLVTDKIEKRIQEIPQIDYIESESRMGVSIVTVFIKETEFNLQPIFDRVRRKVEDAERDLPQEARKPNVKDELGDVFGIIVGLTSQDFTPAELEDVADEIRDGFIKLPNAAKVEIQGAQEERIYIDYDNARLSEYGLSKKMVEGLLASTNILYSGGDFQVGDETIIVEPSGNLKTVEELKKVIVSQDEGRIVYLGDVTNVYRGYVEPREAITSINGKPGIAIAINLIAGGNIIQLGSEVDEKLEEYAQAYPYGIEIERVSSQDIVVNESVQDFIGNLVQSVIVVLIVMLVFLGLRTGLIVASLIPMTIICTFVFMGQFGVGLNQVTLASLIIALGMLVDNAIVVSESIMVRMENGQEAIDAAVSSAQELFVPLLVSSLTTSAAFLAFFLAESVMGEIMGNIFIVVTCALLCSWVLAMTMITMLCVYFLKVKKPTNESGGIFGLINKYYQSLLIWSLKNGKKFIVGIVILFIISLKMFGLLPFTFMPDSERAIVTVNIELPLGTTIDKTESVIKKVEEYMLDNLYVNDERKEGVTSWSSYVKESAPKYDMGYTAPEASSNAAHILLNTTSGEVNQAVIDKLDTFIFDHFPDVKAEVSRLSGAGGGGDPIAIRVTGKNPEKLFKIVDTIKDKLRGVEGSKNVSDDWGVRVKKLLVKINQTKAQLAGVTNEDIAISLQTILDGARVGSFREADQSIPIVMRDAQWKTINVDNIDSVNIYSQKGGNSVPLKQVADLEIVWESAKILRRDLYRTITATSDVKTGYTAQDVSGEVLPWLKEESKQWGVGYSYNVGGESEDSGKAMKAVADKLPLSFFIIVLLLIGQFNSIKKPLIILLTIPLGLIGVIWGLLLCGSYFGFMAFLGVISLAGIVINNAIVLLDRIKIEKEEFSRTDQESIVFAALQRMRPILLTTFTTSFGLIPLWISGGLMWQPMAIGIIFGLLFATVLTLLFVPILYSKFFKINFQDYKLVN